MCKTMLFWITFFVLLCFSLLVDGRQIGIFVIDPSDQKDSTLYIDDPRLVLYTKIPRYKDKKSCIEIYANLASARNSTQIDELIDTKAGIGSLRLDSIPDVSLQSKSSLISSIRCYTPHANEQYKTTYTIKVSHFREGEYVFFHYSAPLQHTMMQPVLNPTLQYVSSHVLHVRHPDYLPIVDQSVQSDFIIPLGQDTMNITIPYRFESSQSLTWPNHVLTAQDVRICYHFQNIRRLKKDRYSHPRDGILYTDTGMHDCIEPDATAFEKGAALLISNLPATPDRSQEVVSNNNNEYTESSTSHVPHTTMVEERYTIRFYTMYSASFIEEMIQHEYDDEEDVDDHNHNINQTQVMQLRHSLSTVQSEVSYGEISISLIEDQLPALVMSEEYALQELVLEDGEESGVVSIPYQVRTDVSTLDHLMTCFTLRPLDVTQEEGQGYRVPTEYPFALLNEKDQNQITIQNIDEYYVYLTESARRDPGAYPASAYNCYPTYKVGQLAYNTTSIMVNEVTGDRETLRQVTGTAATADVSRLNQGIYLMTISVLTQCSEVYVEANPNAFIHRNDQGVPYILVNEAYKDSVLVLQPSVPIYPTYTWTDIRGWNTIPTGAETRIPLSRSYPSNDPVGSESPGGDLDYDHDMLQGNVLRFGSGADMDENGNVVNGLHFQRYVSKQVRVPEPFQLQVALPSPSCKFFLRMNVYKHTTVRDILDTACYQCRQLPTHCMSLTISNLHATHPLFPVASMLKEEQGVPHRVVLNETMVVSEGDLFNADLDLQLKQDDSACIRQRTY